jgi:hypothetical protein
MANEDLIGIVTVTYNSAGVLPDFLRCIAGQSYRKFLLFVVDNASSDKTLAILRDWHDERLKVVANETNHGVAEGNNQGIRAALAAGCESVLLLNNDTEFGSELIAGLLRGMDKFAADMTCPKMLYYDEPKRIWAAGGSFQPWLGYRTIHLGVDELDQRQYDNPRQVTYVPTCCVLIRRRVFAKIGLMDDLYFVYVDDVDFMYRALKAKMILVYLPELELLHKVGRLTGGDTSPFHIRYCTRNRVYFTLKHFGILGGIGIALLYQCKVLLDFAARRLTFSGILLKERSILEGISLWRSNRIRELDQNP